MGFSRFPVRRISFVDPIDNDLVICVECELAKYASDLFVEFEGKVDGKCYIPFDDVSVRWVSRVVFIEVGLSTVQYSHVTFRFRFNLFDGRSSEYVYFRFGSTKRTSWIRVLAGCEERILWFDSKCRGWCYGTCDECRDVGG